MPDSRRRGLLRGVLKRRGLVTEAHDYDELWRVIPGDVFDLAIVSPGALGKNQLASLRAIAAVSAGPDVILIAQRGQSEFNALLAAGCLAVLSEEGSEDDLIAALEALLERARSDRIRRVVAGGRVDRRLDAMGTRSTAIRRFQDAARRIAAVDAPVLIQGEPGTGKTWLGPVIHRESPRASGPFHSLRCANLPAEALESVFFGHTAAALPGPTTAGRGVVERAHQGTLFLEGLDEAPMAFQDKLLRFLDGGACHRVGGGTRSIHADVRLLASVKSQPEERVETGALHRELYRRIGLHNLAPPPLRERPEDIPDLAEAAHQKWCARYGLAVDGFTPAALDALQEHTWPGNVSELWSVVERSTLLSQGDRIGIEALPFDIVPRPGARAGGGVLAVEAPWLRDPSKLPSLRDVRTQALDVVERAYLVELLRSVNGRVAEAARRAEVDPRSLYGRMNQYGLRKESFKPLRRPRQRRSGGEDVAD